MKNVEKKENKLKQLVEKHKLAFTIAGGVIVLAAGVGLIYLGYRDSTNIDADRIIKELAAKDAGVAKLVQICEACDAGTAGTTIVSAPVPVTVAEFLGEEAERFVEGSRYKLDDIVANIIINIAKKPEV